MMASGSAVQVKGLGLSLVSARNRLMAAWRSTMPLKTPRLSRCRVSLAKKPSTALSQEAEVGVKWKWNLGCRSSQARHLGVFVCGVVVDDQVQLPPGRGLAIDLVEKADEFLMPVARHALADGAALQHVERGEQCGRAMALVVMRHRPAAGPLHRQSWLGAVERLDLRLLVDRQHQRVLRRIDVQTDDILHLGGELRRTETRRATQPAVAGPSFPRYGIKRTRELFSGL